MSIKPTVRFLIFSVFSSVSSAANEMDDLDFVIVAHDSFGPTNPSDDTAIQFDRDAPLRQRKKPQKPIQTDIFRNFAGFAIE